MLKSHKNKILKSIPNLTDRNFDGVPFMKISLFIILMVGLTSCFEGPKTTKVINNTTTTNNGGASGSGSSGSGGSGGAGGGSWTGGSGSSGSGSAPSYITWDIKYAGGVSWYPRDVVEPERYNCNSGTNTTYTSSQCLNANTLLLSEGTPTTSAAKIAFQSDNRYKVRVTVNPKPAFSSGTSSAGSQNSNLDSKIYCYGRKIPMAQETGDNYTKLSFKVRLWSVSSCSSSGCAIGSVVATETLSNIPVNGSAVIDFSTRRPPSPNPYFIEITDVRKDNGDLIRSGACWGMRLELATDYTQDF